MRVERRQAQIAVVYCGAAVAIKWATPVRIVVR